MRDGVARRSPLGEPRNRPPEKIRDEPRVDELVIVIGYIGRFEADPRQEIRRCWHRGIERRTAREYQLAACLERAAHDRGIILSMRKREGIDRIRRLVEQAG